MKDKIQSLLEEIKAFKAENNEQLEKFRIKFLSKKGIITGLFTEFKNVPKEHRKELGRVLNELKNKVQEKVNFLREKLEDAKTADKSDKDLTLPVDFIELGTRHPLSIVRNEIIDIFARIGFTVAEGLKLKMIFTTLQL